VVVEGLVVVVVVMMEAGVVTVVVDMVMMGMVVVDMAMMVMVGMEVTMTTLEDMELEDMAEITWEDMVMIMAAMDMLLTVVSSSMEVVRCHHREGVVLPVADHISDVTLYSKLYTPLQAKTTRAI